jgi:hypothetical protein
VLHEITAGFRDAQHAFARGDVDAVARQLYQRASRRAKRRADAVRALRQAPPSTPSPRQLT